MRVALLKYTKRLHIYWRAGLALSCQSLLAIGQREARERPMGSACRLQSFRVAGSGEGHRSFTSAHLNLLVAVLGRVLAPLALPPQLLQLCLALFQALTFALMLHLVLLQCRL